MLMKFFTKLLTAFLFLIILSADTKAQTTLSQGDISIVGFTSNVNQSNTGFCFVSYVNLSAGTVIKFTCNDMTAAAASSTASSAWNTNTNQTLYWTASSAVSAGTVVSITSTSSFSALAASTGSITYGTSGNGGNGTSFGMVNSGRNVFVFQYGSTNDFDASSSSTATFNGSGLIFGLVYAGGLGSSTYLASGTGSAFKGYQPTDLSSSYTVTGLGATVRYSAYSGSTSGFASLAAAKSAINNAGNWTSGTTTTGAATFPGNFTFPSSNTAPTFTNSTPQTLTVCQNASATSINTLLTVSDADASQTETWSVTTAPTHGTLGGFNATASSGSTSITPTGLTYTPTNGYSGSDQFIIQVSDGTATASMTVNVTVNALPTITLGSVSSVNTSATSFSLPYSATTGSPDQYSIVTGSPTAMSSFSAVSNATLGSSPISVTIPASAANTYNFNATVTNSTTGCISASNAFTVLVFGAPTTQATNVSYSSTTTTQTGISWTNGNGSSRAVFVAAASSGTPSAVTNTTYTANTVFGSGTQISSSGWYCVYNGTGTSVTVTGLTAGTIYRTMVVEYNGSAGTEVYYTSTATGNPANITMPTSTTWNGTSWSNGNPSSTIDAIVSDVSNTAPASFSCKNLTINSGAALNCTGITATINGNITNSGNGISGTGTLTIAATCAVTGNFFIFSGIINLSSGTFTTGGRITIAPGGAITGTYSNLSGSVALQQSIIAQRGWRMFAHPFTTAQTFASIAGANNVTINTSAGPAGIADTRVFNNSSNAWVDAGTSPTANTAYGLFIRGITTDIQGGGTGLTYAAGPTAFTYTVAGTLNTGNYTVPAPSNTSNFTLVGNPFAAPVNSSELTNGTGVSYYVYQISVSGDGRTKAGAWSTVLSSSATTPIPVLGVIAWKPSSSYTIHTSGINTSDAAATGLFGIETPIPHIELQIEQNGNQQDNFFVRLDPAATANGTDKTDLDKFYNDNVNVYSITDDKNRLGVDARNVLDKIPLGISALAGDYNFKLADNNLPTGTTVYLNDKYLNTQTALKVGDTYPFTISSDASTMGEQRFELSFSIKSTAAANDPPRSLTANVLGNITSGNLIAVQIGGATTPVTIAVKDMNGKALGTMSAANGIQYVNVGNTAKGMLLLQISDGKSSIIKKVMKL